MKKMFTLKTSILTQLPLRDRVLQFMALTFYTKFGSVSVHFLFLLFV